MNNSIYPCLWFDGKAKEAADLYCNTFSNAAISFESPMVVIFTIEGKTIMGLNGGPMFSITPAISFFVACDTEDEIQKIWDRLMDGGKIMMALDKYPWSDKYGW